MFKVTHLMELHNRGKFCARFFCERDQHVEGEKSEMRKSDGFATLEEGRITTEQPCSARWKEGKEMAGEGHAVEVDLVNDPKSRRTPWLPANEEADEVLVKLDVE